MLCVCHVLVTNDSDGKNWDFVKLAEAIKQWTKRNPVYEESDVPSGKFGKSGKVYQTKTMQVCVYCEGEHKTGECEVVTSVKKRREILTRKKHCFNCAAGQPFREPVKKLEIHGLGDASGEGLCIGVHSCNTTIWSYSRAPRFESKTCQKKD